jgi:hypothetical protein
LAELNDEVLLQIMSLGTRSVKCVNVKTSGKTGLTFLNTHALQRRRERERVDRCFYCIYI